MCTTVNVSAVQAATSPLCLWQERRVAALVEVAHKLSRLHEKQGLYPFTCCLAVPQSIN